MSVAKEYFERAVAIVEEQRHRMVAIDLRCLSADPPYRELFWLALDDTKNRDQQIASVAGTRNLSARASLTGW